MTRAPAAAPVRLRRTVQPPDVLALAGIILWAVGLLRVHTAHIGDLGLVSVLGWTCLLGLAFLVAGFVWQLTSEPVDRRRLGLYLVVLVVMLDGLPAIVEATARTPTGWIHAGFIDYILRHGRVLPHYDARFSWPGMFSLSALVTVAGGRSSAITFLRWTPLVLNLLYLLPLRLIARRCATDARVGWMATALFVIGNWVEQDYFSPQGVAYIAFLSVLAVALATVSLPDQRQTLGRMAARLVRPRATVALPSWLARGGVVCVLTVIMAGLVVSHQLTPYGLLIELVVLAVWDQLGSRSLIVLLAVLAVGYLSLGAQDFWSGHLSVVVGSVGHVGNSVNQSVVQRTHVSSGHRLVVEARLGFSLLLILLGGAGALVRSRRPGGPSMLVAVLAVAPFGLLGLQSYGGEVLLRSLLMALPFLALLIAELPFWFVRRAPRIGLVGAAVFFAAAATGLLIARYGNEPFYRTVTATTRSAAPGSTVAALSQNLPWRFEDIERLKFASFEKSCPAAIDQDCLKLVKADYIVITDGERRYAELVQGRTPAEVATLEQSLLPSAGYRLALSIGDASVYARSGVAGP
jgi:hypothetical protein